MRRGHQKERPALRGVSHALAAMASIAGALALWEMASGDRAKQISMLVFGLSLVGLYASSAAYHLGRWRGTVYTVLRRLDHAMIFILIAGTYTPFCFNVLEGSERITMLALVWSVATTGVILKIFFPFLSRRASVPLYLITGWLAIFKAEAFTDALSRGALALVLLGGVAYTVGAIIYGFRRPNPLPRLFGYHEIFHLLVIVGSVTHFLAVFYYVVPFPRA
jgi:hemolysin III